MTLHYVDVILPLPLPDTYTYAVDENQLHEIAIGKRVSVQFGKKKLYVAIIYSIHHNKPGNYKVKSILSVLDDRPLIIPQQLQLWEWIASYYMCYIGEVFKAAIPSGLKMDSETRINLVTESLTPAVSLDPGEELICHMLHKHPKLQIRKLASMVGKGDILPSIKSLLEKNMVYLEENLKEGYKPKNINYIRLAKEYTTEAELNGLMDSLSRAKSQLKLLLAYLSVFPYGNNYQPKWIEKKVLVEKTGVSQAVIQATIKKGLFESEYKPIKRKEIYAGKAEPLAALNNHQKEALIAIKSEFEQKQVVLLHGVTSSGKTEIYMHLIQEQLARKKQVLYLLPEIALTTQIISRLTRVFGNKVGIYHSKYSDANRVEIYKDLLEGKIDIILGVRSSVFLPFQNLGLIIVDEEHENTYKQFDPAPRYHARDTAIVLAQQAKAKVLLGTATPAIESYYNAKTGKYGLVELTSRYEDMAMPVIQIVDVKKERMKKKMHTHFSSVLINEITSALQNKEQIILFQNRRGFSIYLECAICGWIPYCKHCDVSLTYHKKTENLVCHYCGYTQKIPHTCQDCGSNDIQTCGFGTEKIEEEIALLFPDIRIARLDHDTTGSRRNYERIISEFESGKIHILVGTQMITKGLDFDHVSCVGILNADNLLNFPDFRSYERSYQLMTQVSGRAGRKHKQGKVIIQTSHPDNSIIKSVIEHSYLNMYNSQLEERELFKYPPFYRLIKITLKAKHKSQLEKVSNEFARQLKTQLAERVLGPETPLISRISNYYIKQILLKIEKEKSISQIKQMIQHISYAKYMQVNYPSVRIIYDMDPM